MYVVIELQLDRWTDMVATTHVSGERLSRHVHFDVIGRLIRRYHGSPYTEGLSIRSVHTDSFYQVCSKRAS